LSIHCSTVTQSSGILRKVLLARTVLKVAFFLAVCVTCLGRADNDDFAQAITIEGTQGSIYYDCFGATLEEGEPVALFGSVWYRWQSPSDGLFQLTSLIAARLYTGEGVRHLESVPSGYPPPMWMTKRDQTYWLAINQQPNGRGTVPFKFFATRESDSFAGRVPLSSTSSFSAFLNATTEANEPGAQPGLGSIWWGAPEGLSGNVMVRFKSQMFGTVTIYEGEEPGKLVQVAQTSVRAPEEEGFAAFEALPGKIYSVSFLGAVAEGGVIQIGASTSGMDLSISEMGEKIVLGEPVRFDFENIPETPKAARLKLLTSIGDEIASFSPPFPSEFVATNLTAGSYSVQLVLESSGEIVAATGLAIKIVTPNDAFADRTVLEGVIGAFTVPPGATIEPNEPPLTDDLYPASSWYRWTAPADGALIVRYPFGQVFTGSALSNLVAVPVSPNVFANRFFENPFLVEKGVEYSLRFCRSPFNPSSVNFSFRFFAYPIPNNDNFADAAELSIEGNEATFRSSVFGGTIEPGEPSWDFYNASSWYRWTPSENGTLQAEVTYKDFQPGSGIAIFGGTTLGSAVPFTNWAWPYRAPVHKGEAIYIQHVGVSSDSEGASIHLRFFPQPANDDFSHAQMLTGEQGEFVPNTQAATDEPEEIETGLGPAVWYRWQSPEAGLLRIAPGYTFVSLMHGSTLSELTNVAPLSSISRLFPVDGGQTYYVRVPYNRYPPSDSTFSYQFFPGFRPPNDNFADAILLEGLSLQFDVMTGYATESAEDPGDNSVNGTNQPLRHTVWYDWISPLSGWTTIAVTASVDYQFAPDTSRAVVYRGSPEEGFVEVGSTATNTPWLGFQSEEGQNYHILVAQTQLTSSGALLHFSLNATALKLSSPTNGIVLFDDEPLKCELALIEAPGEGQITNVTYKLTQISPKYLAQEKSVDAPPFSAILSNFYPRSFELSAIVNQANPNRSVSLEPVTVNIRSRFVPEDFFAERELLQGTVVTRYFSEGEVVVATREPGEPRTRNDAPTLWFRWIAPFDGTLRIGEGALATNVFIFEGSELTNLVHIPLSQGVLKGHEYAIQVSHFSVNVPLTIWLDTLLYDPPTPSLLSERDPVSFDVRTREDANIAEVRLYGGDRLVKTLKAPAFLAAVNLAAGTYDIRSVHQLRDGTAFTNILIRSATVYASNIFANAAVVLTNSSVSINTAGFQEFIPGGTGIPGNGPLLYYRSNPDGDLLVFSQSWLDVVPMTNGFVHVAPVASEDILYYQGTIYDSSVYRLQAGKSYQLTVFLPLFPNASIFVTPPLTNDNIENALTIESDATEFETHVYLSTIQPGERAVLGPGLANVRGSVWYEWKAPVDGFLALDGIARLFSGTGTNDLHELPKQEAVDPLCNVYSINKDQPYRLGVFPDGRAPFDRTIRLRLATNSLLANDDRQNATLLSGTNISQFFLYPLDATYEAGEDHRPYYFGGPGFGSVWWKWRAPANGELFPSLQSPGHGDRLTVYRQGAAEPIRATLGEGTAFGYAYAVQSGQEYLVAVERVNFGSEERDNFIQMILDLRFVPYPPNDSFELRQALTGSDIELAIPQFYASREFREPRHAGEGAEESIWYEWTCPNSGLVRIEADWTIRNWRGGLVTVYQGDDLASLNSVAFLGSASPDAFTVFQATAGVTYKIAIDNLGLREPVHLKLKLTPALVQAVSLSFVSLSEAGLTLALSSNVGTDIAVQGSPDLSVWADIWRTNLNERGELLVPLSPIGNRYFRIRSER
jgi:hypothetical protein